MQSQICMGLAIFLQNTECCLPMNSLFTNLQNFGFNAESQTFQKSFFVNKGAHNRSTLGSLQCKIQNFPDPTFPISYF